MGIQKATAALEDSMIGIIAAVVIALVVVWLIVQRRDVSRGRPSGDADAVTRDARYIDEE